MDEFRALVPHIRCFALVGQFLQHWALMEQAIHTAIGNALGVELIKLQILVANISFRDKTNIVLTLVDVSPHLNSVEKTEYQKALRSIADYSPNRNMVAHDHFQPSSISDGVGFSIVKAKGKFSTPSIDWDISKFEQEYEKLISYRNVIETIGSKFATHPVPPMYYRDSYITHPSLQFPPMLRQMSPVLMDSLIRQAEAPPNNDLPSQENSFETPPKIED